MGTPFYSDAYVMAFVGFKPRLSVRMDGLPILVECQCTATEKFDSLIHRYG